ncbi:hypothetical protein [Enterococcus termitis]|uniref:Uncharacterized protein n=1 Tax=Enterococcus termitis TaxID=332950 RepID=A0A1E5GVR3_9ENTE|nr:hypothetical protein [Enterococcus termitis]OEG16778.1 hypothetical protein BCR25_04060 [Enterococcus termitis]OJG99487.1 hypothetical protein RV18_GL001555 [Enterococcus termitis]
MKKVYSVEDLSEKGYFIEDDIAWRIEDSLRKNIQVFQAGTNGELVVGVFPNGDEFEIGRIKKIKIM